MMRPGRLVALSTLLVVVVFTLSLAYAQFRLVPITQHALDVTENAVPSIAHLSTARAELIRFGLLLTEYAVRLGDGGLVSRQDITGARQTVEAELAAYRALPSFPDEAEQLADVDQALARLDASTARTLDRIDRGSSDAARRTLAEEVIPNLQQASETLLRLKTHNLAYTQQSIAGILRARRSATVVAIVFGLLSVVVAVTAAVLVLRVLRARARLIEDHTRLLAARAGELEAFAGRVAHDL
jgi:hypothetical protein